MQSSRSRIVVNGQIRSIDGLNYEFSVSITVISLYACTVQHPGDIIDATQDICDSVVDDHVDNIRNTIKFTGLDEIHLSE